MPRLRITKEFHFEAAHFLPGYDGLCANLHGHSYRLYITLRGAILNAPQSPKDGMVLDFSVLKSIVEHSVVNVLDHALIARRGTDILTSDASTNFRILYLEQQPTSENLLLWIVNRLHENLPTGLELYAVKLCETATSSVEWSLADTD